jgi:7-keto-8-aminopelargonate synthetase-like enzyme
MGTEAAIVYSMHVATASSVVAAFVNKEDTIYVQYGVNVSLLNGIRLTRSKDLHVFKTTSELSNLLNVKVAKPSLNFRRWIICEGGLSNDVDLRQVVDLKTKAGAYLILDDSLCIGVTGRTGRGSVEKYGVSVTEVDAIVGSLEHALGSVGGFCCGRKDVTEHQTLYGSGYCFSASAPACLEVAGYKAIGFLKSPAGLERLESLQENIAAFVNGARTIPGLKLLSAEESYSQVIYFDELTAEAVYKNLASVRTQPVRLPPLQKLVLDGVDICRGSESKQLRITLSSEMTRADVSSILADLSAAMN